MRKLFAGDRLTWAVAGGITALVALGAVVALALPGHHYTGTNSVAVQNVLTKIDAGGRLCIPGLNVPDGTGRVRLAVFWKGEGSPVVSADVRAGGRTEPVPVDSLPGVSPVSGARMDIPISEVEAPRETLPGSVCIRPSGKPLEVGGRVKSSSPEAGLRLDGRPLRGEAAVWFLPPAGDHPSAMSQLPKALERASVFRPGFVGPWTYVILLFVLPPLLWVAAIRLLATRVAGQGGGARTALVIVLLAFAVGLTWAFLTPSFNAPDEPDHFAYAQDLVERGEAPGQAPGRPAYSSRLAEALNSARIYDYAERSDGRPPWLERDEKGFEPSFGAGDDGGGNLASTTTHAPPFYALAGAAYLATPSDNTFSKLAAMRALSALCAALTAALAFLAVRELAPGRDREWLPVAAGLIVAFQPMFGFVSGSLNNDNGVNLAAALLVYLLLRSLRRGLSIPLGIAIGATAAIAPLLKASGYALLVAAALGLAGMMWRERSSRQLRFFATATVAFLGVNFAWSALADTFGRQTFTTPGGESPTSSTGVVGGLLDDPLLYLDYLWQTFLPRLPWMPDLFPQVWPAFDIYVERGWAAFGWYALLFPGWVYGLVLGAMLITGVLAIVALVRERQALKAVGWQAGVLALALIGVIGGVAAIYRSGVPRPVVAEQGRYVFTAIVPLAALAVASAFAFGRLRAPMVASALAGLVIGFSFASQMLALTRYFM